MPHRIYSARYWRLDNRLRDGPIGSYVDEFASLLLTQGYPERELKSRFAVIAKLNQWLIRKKLDLSQLDTRRIAQFVQFRS